MTETTTEKIERRHGENLYPVQFAAEFGDHLLRLECPQGVWNPTPHGVHLADMLLEIDLEGADVLELGTGCGIHAILIARRGARRMTLTEIDEPTLCCARHNLEKHGAAIPIEYVVADWTSLPDARHDVLITNPPFAKSGKVYRRCFIDKLILDAHRLVRPGGRLIFVQSSMANVPRTLELLAEHGTTVRIVGEADGPFRDYYFEDPDYLTEMAAVPGGYDLRGGTYYERLTVFEATLP